MQPTQSRSESELWKQANLLFALQHRVYIKIAKASVYIGILFIFLPSRLYSRGVTIKSLWKPPQTASLYYTLLGKVWKKKKKSQSVSLSGKTHDTYQVQFHNHSISTGEAAAQTATPSGHGDVLWLFFRFIFCRRELKQILKKTAFVLFMFEEDVQTCKWHQCFLETHRHSLFQGGNCDKLNSRRNKQDIIWNATHYENVSSKGLGKVQRVCKGC